MTPAFERLQQVLKGLPGLGFRSAERVALHLLVEHRDRLALLQTALAEAAASVGRCQVCGHLCEGDTCTICLDDSRRADLLCLVEHVPDLLAIERAQAFRGRYHVLHGRLSPMHGIGPDELNLATLPERLAADGVQEVILALANDLEGEATCHYLQDHVFAGTGVTVTRIGFGLPSGGHLGYADSTTLRSALDGRRPLP